MKTKQEVIEAAYGDRWERVKKFADENGWINCDPFRVGLFWDQVDAATLNEESFYRWRLVSLRGIEDNNGWYTIHGPEDLPKEKGYYYGWWREDTRSEPKSRMWFDPDSNNWVEHWLDWFSLWHPEIQPPVYLPEKGGPQ